MRTAAPGTQTTTSGHDNRDNEERNQDKTTQAGTAEQFWTPEFWQKYCELKNPYREYKLACDTSLVVDLLNPLEGERVLEVGCGYGRISRALLDAKAGKLVAVDFSAAMLRGCAENTRRAVHLCGANAGQLPFKDSSFDVVVCTGVLMHLDDQSGALNELSRVLRPGGRLLISGNNLLSPYALPTSAFLRLRHRPTQKFRLPWFYRSQLRKRQIQVRKVVGDTVLAVAFTLPGSETSLLPKGLFRVLRSIDRWVTKAPLSYLAYEMWFLGVKGGSDAKAKSVEPISLPARS
jgi:SAM-dependent methyltransferase